MRKFAAAPLALIFAGSVVLAKGAQPIAAQANSSAVAAQPALGALDAATQEALQKTQQGLTNPAARAEMIKGDAKAQAQDAKVKAILGDQSENAYQISSQLLETLVLRTNGDPTKMQEIVGQLMANPQLIEQYLSTAQRDQIHQMASEIEGKKGSTPVSGHR